MDFLEKEHIERLKEKYKIIIIFPFNVFGNIAPISLVLCKLRAHKIDFLLFVYKNNDETIQMRKQYYKNCGYKEIEICKNAMGILFKSREGLYTIAYHKEYLYSLLKAFDFDVCVSESKYGFVFYVLADK